MPNPRGSNTTLGHVPVDLTGLADGQGLVWNAAEGLFVPGGGGVGDSYTAVKTNAALDGNPLAGWVLSTDIAPVGTSLSLVGGEVRANAAGSYDVTAEVEYTGGGTDRDVVVYVVALDESGGNEVVPSYVLGGAGKQTGFNGLNVQTTVLGIPMPVGGVFGAVGYAANGAVGDTAANYRVMLRVVRRS